MANNHTSLQGKEKIRCRLFLSLTAGLVTAALGWSIISRAVQIFFLPGSRRYFWVGVIGLAALVCAGLAWFLFGKKDCRKFLRYLGRMSVFIILSAAVSAFVILSEAITLPDLAYEHLLEIEATEQENGDANTIFITGITEIVTKPEEGAVRVDLSDAAVEGNARLRADGVLELEGGSLLRYRSFYAGCIQISFLTSPESYYAHVRFDRVEQNYNLNAPEVTETRVNHCSGLPFLVLPAKWQVITAGMYLMDWISGTAIIGGLVMIVQQMFFSRSAESEEFIREAIPWIAGVIVGISILQQILRITVFSDERITLAPPALPAVVEGKFDFQAVYEASRHRGAFAHAFIFSFMDIYSELDAVYIDGDTLEKYDFSSQKFNWWFEFYNPQPASSMPLTPSEAELDDIIGGTDWLEKYITIPAEALEFTMHYTDDPAESFALITSRGNDFYLISDTLLLK